MELRYVVSLKEIRDIELVCECGYVERVDLSGGFLNFRQDTCRGCRTKWFGDKFRDESPVLLLLSSFAMMHDKKRETGKEPRVQLSFPAPFTAPVDPAPTPSP